MDEELKKKLLGYLENGEKAIKEAGPALNEEAHALVREFIAWRLTENILWATACLVMVGALLYLGRRVCRAVVAHKDEIEESGPPHEVVLGLVCFFMGILTLPFAINFMLFTTEAVKTAVAPRVVVLEQVSKMVRGK